MCATCGCSSSHAGALASDHQHDDGHGGHHDGHDHEGKDHERDGRGHGHESGLDELGAPPAAAARRVIDLERDVLARNDRLAEDNRRWLADRGIFALNLMSSPGSGKTTLLERTIRELRPGRGPLGSGRALTRRDGAVATPVELSILVIEGDQETARDAERIRNAGTRAVQITTGKTCHLDARMVAQALADLDPPRGSVVAIENVGNLVCPALFDLGEHARVVVVSVTEGDDKPIKYPHMFRASDVVVLNKIDLLPYVDFDVDRCLGLVREVNPRLVVLQVSATRGDGLGDWYAWLVRQAAACQARPLTVT
jgi:hydrogenase nickel incorporation protein HypB